MARKEKHYRHAHSMQKIEQQGVQREIEKRDHTRRE